MNKLVLVIVLIVVICFVVTAVYLLQQGKPSTSYYLNMSSNFGSNYVLPKSGYYAAGSIIHISIITPQITTTIDTSRCSRYGFNWVGTGLGSYSGTSDQANITMGGPINETAHFFTCVPISTSTTLPPG